jgi:AcrR family transcriptional regulator
MVERTMTPAAQRVLDTAGRLFYQKGIGQVGMELIASEVYDRFGSKETLILAYLRVRDEGWRAVLNERLAGSDDPRERILLTFDATGDWQRRNGARGCSMVNACAELPDPEHPVHRAAARQKAWLRELYAELVAEAGLGPALADRLLILHEGAMVTYSVAGVENATEIARDTAAMLMSGGI